MTLAYDISRCSGTTAPVCQYCRRREPGREHWQSYILQWPESPNFCSMLIASEETYSTSDGTSSKKIKEYTQPFEG